MDDFFCCNQVSLTGIPEAEPSLSHESRGALFFTFPLLVERLSGYADRLNIVAREELLPLLRERREGFVHIDGELRSFNNRSGEGSRLVITVYAQQLTPPEEAAWENRVELAGTLCKAPNPRRTPMGREICDLMLAVNRRYGRSDYLPCIVWGQNARLAGDWAVGDRLALEGRVQSREYIKNMESGSVRRVAYEVSVAALRRLDAPVLTPMAESAP